MAISTEQILGSDFYTCHKEGKMFLGLLLPGGVFYEVFDELEWRQWLREEYARSHPLEIPTSFKEVMA